METVFRIIFLTLTLLACNREVELEQPHYEENIVVDGYIETGRSARIYLTMSSPFLTHYDSASIRNSFLNYAKITLSSSVGEQEVLTLFREKRFFPPFVYRSIEIKGQAGVEYNITVEVKGRELTASTSIPEAPVVVDSKINRTTDTTGIVEIATLPPSSGEQYLFKRIQSQWADEELHPSYAPMVVVSSDVETIVWHEVLRIPEFRLYRMNPDSAVYNQYEKFEYDVRDTLRVLAGAVDSASYHVLNSLFSDQANHENPFAFNGDNLETNITGGIGHWTGIGISNSVILGEENGLELK